MLLSSRISLARKSCLTATAYTKRFSGVARSFFGALLPQHRTSDYKCKQGVTVTKATMSEVSETGLLPDYIDHSSFSNVHDIRATHLDLALDVDFEHKKIRGLAVWKMQVLNNGTQIAAFDTRGLLIKSVDVAPGLTGSAARPHYEAATWHLHPEDPVLGAKLVVPLPSSQSELASLSVKVTFEAGEGSTATQWLAPSMTASGLHPYLFTQCQAIHARSLLPCQDSPGAKFTYSSVVRVPKPLTALMSALPRPRAAMSDPDVSLVPSFAAHFFAKLEAEGGEGGEGGEAHFFSFDQKVPIPSYLLALAVGDLESRDVGPRSRVWAEPSVVEGAAYEFGGTEEYLKAAEEIAGEYVWGRYDLLCLPFSFPYGGMENPCLTFVTPTLLAGDRSLTNVVAHEIAHSWTGNLVTNASWQDFWLNEGFTVFLERKILQRLKGQATYDFAAAQGFSSLSDTVKGLGEGHKYTALVPDLSGGGDPDDAFSRVPYEKGFYLLHHLSDRVGHEAFEGFLKAYLKKFRYQVLTTSDFVTYFTEYFSGGGEGGKALEGLDWDTWLYGRGLPPQVNSYDPSLASASYSLALRWHTADLMRLGGVDKEYAGLGGEDIKGWSSDQVVAFLERLGQLSAPSPLHRSTTRLMNDLYGLDGSQNAEIRFAWLKLCIGAGDGAVTEGAIEFLRSQGRMKFVRPLFRKLLASPLPGVKDRAVKEFEDNLSRRYHPICVKMVQADIRGSSAQAD